MFNLSAKIVIFKINTSQFQNKDIASLKKQKHIIYVLSSIHIINRI